jgi:hypothetical protein
MVQDCTACILNLSEHMACTREKRNACRVLEGKPEAKSMLGRPGHKYDDNIAMDLK